MSTDIASFRQTLRDALARKQQLQVSGATDPYVHLAIMAALAELDETACDRIVVVVPKAKDISSWNEFLQYNLSDFGVEGAVLPSFSGWGRDRYVNPQMQRRQRMYALARAARTKSLVVTTLPALAQMTMRPEDLLESSRRLKIGEEWDIEDFVLALQDMGYNASPSVDEEGVYAVKGGIIDVYPMNHLNPIRIEFFGDEISSMRHFSAQTQRSIDSVDEVLIAPAFEAVTPEAKRKEHAQRLFNHLLEIDANPSDRDGMVRAFQQGARFSGFEMFLPMFREASVPTIEHFLSDALFIFPQTIESCLQAFDDFHRSIVADYAEDLTHAKPSLPVPRHFVDVDLLHRSIKSLDYRLEFGNPFGDPQTVKLNFAGPPVSFTTGVSKAAFDQALTRIEELLENHGKAIILGHHSEHLERISNLLAHRRLFAKTQQGVVRDMLFNRLEESQIYLAHGSLPGSVFLEEDKVLITTDSQILGGVKRKSASTSRKLQNYLSSFRDLKTGDLIVHVQHGIGRYAGMESLVVGGLTNDFLVLEYAGGDKIYMPVDRLSLLQRYSSGQEGAGRVDKLGGVQWDKRKSKARKAIRDMAEQLLKLQAKRAVSQGQSYSLPDENYLKFEASFPYDETEDQIRALNDVEADLREARPMDRLICGDVGFGKTEIALRASFRTILEGFQVLVLVPTTVLCYQHYRTFASRLGPFGARVAMINRFVSRADARSALEDLEKGSLDVLIGTHRLLSKDIKPQRLGLLVVDEEQRFGVGHKEKLKELRASANVLTLTATPIPRTLHMSMVGLRDISIIATPPQDRLSVKTYIAKFDESLIRDAILQEIRRGGQVFFVHNRVQDIEEMATFIRSLVPHLEVRTGHGQMREHQLERVIVDFIEQKFPILVCTTIIESGIDMPNVNTMIVNRADRFGLAQLYQLRGRVGRSNQQAYAYFLTPEEERISDDAKKRLDVLAAHQELGAGFQIASHDLELRGAGNLLGGEQSGHAASVGLEMYTEMLEQAIQSLRGEEVRERIDTEIKLPISAVISKSYIKDENHRLQMYKTMFSTEDVEELSEFTRDMEDRYGPAPRPVKLLISIARLKQQLRGLGAVRIAASGGKIVEVQFHNLDDERIDRILRVTRQDPKVYRLAPDNRLLIFTEVPREPLLEEQEALIKHLTLLLDPLL